MIDDSDKFIEASVSTIETSLLVSAKSGEQEAWEKIVFVFGRVVYAWIRRYGAPRSEAADLRQLVFESVFKNLDKFRRESDGDTFRGWLRTIARNKVVDYWRRKNRIPKTATDQQIEICLNRIAIEQHSGLHELSSVGENREIIARILEFAKLKIRDDHWNIFFEIVMGKKSREEIAKEYSFTRAYVDVIFSRVVSKLRDEFSQFPESE